MEEAAYRGRPLAANSIAPYRTMANAFATAVYDWSRDPDMVARLVALNLEELQAVVDLWQLQVFENWRQEFWDTYIIMEYITHPSWGEDTDAQIREKLLLKEKWSLMRKGLSRQTFLDELYDLVKQHIDEGVGGPIEREFVWWIKHFKLPGKYHQYPLQWKRFLNWIENDLPTRTGKLPAAIRKFIGKGPIRPQLLAATEEVLDPTDSRVITFWDLFAGAGGFTVGVALSGMIPTFALEWDADAAATYQANWPNVQMYQGAIEDWLEEFKEGDFPPIQRPDLIIGGPPCQGFSHMGRKEGALFEGHRVPEMVETIHWVRPTAFVIENVPNMLTRFESEVFRATRSLEHVGYQIEHKIVDSSDFGLPQSRKRLLIVGSLNGKFEFPNTLYGDRLRPDMPFTPCNSIEALFNGERFGSPNTLVPKFSPIGKTKYGDKWNAIRSDFYMSNFVSDQWLRPLDWEGIVTHAISKGPSQDWFDTEGEGHDYWCDLRTVKEARNMNQPVRETQKAWNIEWTDPESREDVIDRVRCLEEYDIPDKRQIVERRKNHVPGASPLTWQECAALQGFPADYNWRPDDYPRQTQKSSIFDQIGNAVPSVLGLLVARALIDQELV